MSKIQVLDDHAAIWRISKREAPLEPAPGDVFAVHVKGSVRGKEYVVRKVIVRPDGYVVLCRVEGEGSEGGQGNG
jgi:hypothetical protein